MYRSPLPIPFNLLTLVAEFHMDLPGTWGYKIKVWRHQEGRFEARVSIRIRTPDHLLTFDTTGDSVEAAVNGAVSSVSTAATMFEMLDLEKHVEEVRAEHF